MPLQKTQRLEGGRRIRGDLRAARPLVSIIMVLFRDREECVRLLNNIFTFDPCEFELLVFDGGSDDGTADVLREWDDKIDYWLSEPDSGIYDAMNKGVAAATGEYVFHLNAGDTLKSIPSETLAACLKDQVDVASLPSSRTGEDVLPKDWISPQDRKHMASSRHVLSAHSAHRV